MASPSEVRALFLEAVEAFKRGEFRLSIDRFRSVLKADPNAFPAMEWLAKLLSSQGEYREATQICARMMQLRPEHPAGPSTLGLCYLDQGQPAEALDFMRRAAELAPSAPQYHYHLGRILSRLRQFDAAASEFGAAISLAPDLAVHYEELGRVLQVLGRFDEAEQAFTRAIDLDPRGAGPYLAIASGKRFTEEDRPFLERLEKLASDEARSTDDLRKLNYAIAKGYADLRQYEPAMRRYEQANMLARQSQFKGAPFDPKAHRAWIDDQIRTFTAGFFRRYREVGSNSRRPLFIIGMIRSGTTLTEQILSSHSKIGAAGEVSFWTDQVRSGVLKRMTDGRIDLAEWQALAPAYLKRLEELAPGFSVITDKMPTNYLNLGLIHLVFPEAKIIHCRRSPIDTCLSIYMTPFDNAAEFSYDRQSIVDGYREYQRIMAHWRRTIPSDLMLEIEYEDLVADPEPVIRRMLAHLGLQWEDACLHHESNERSVQTPSAWQVRQPLYQSSVERWRAYEPWLAEFKELLPNER